MRRLVWQVLCIAIAMQSTIACVGAKDANTATGKSTLWQNAIQNQHVTVRGMVRRVGNDRFNYLVISDEQDKEWNLDEAAQILLNKYEQRVVIVSGTVELQKVVMADGTEPFLPRRVLRDVKLVP